MFKLIRFLKPYSVSAAMSMLLKFTETMLELFVPLIMAGLIEAAFYGTAVSFAMGAFVFAVITACGIMAVFAQYFAARASSGFGKDLRDALNSHINSLDCKSLDRFGASSLITRVTNDALQVQQAFFMFLRVGARAPFMMLGSLVMAVVLDSFISLIFIGVLLVMAAVVFFVLRRAFRMFASVQARLDTLAAVSKEGINGTRVIRAFSRQEYENERFSNAAHDYKKGAVRVAAVASLLAPANALLLQLGMAGILIVGGFRVEYNGFSAATLTAFVTYMLQIMLAVTIITSLVVLFIRASACASRLNEVFECQPAVLNQSGIAEFDRTKHAVEFRTVRFGYGGGRVLTDVSFFADCGECVGVIGGTGSGKSTVLNLAAALYQPKKGEIEIFGRSPSAYNSEFLRSRIGVAPQRAVLLRGSVRENIDFGRGLCDADILRAVQTAQADFLFDKEGGLDFKIVRDGRNFSGGQRQRISIARALANNPDIIILDDSTGALDYITEAQFLLALKKNYPNACVILASQRVTSVSRCNRIIVLEGGAVSGVGTHAQLLKSNAVYADICSSQGEGALDG